MKNLAAKQLRQLDKKEHRIIQRGNRKTARVAVTITKKMEENIPDKLKQVLDATFYQGFCLVFSKGVSVIESAGRKEKLAIEFDVNNYAVDKTLSAKSLRNLDRQAKKTQIINTCITTFEGTGLGLLGIGLPDIPVFIGLLLKGIFETALSYGFTYETAEERYFILLLIRTALSEGDTKALLNSKLNETAYLLARGEKPVFLFEDELKAASNSLADEMLTAKFIQGLPVVGVVGGICNLTTARKIFNFSSLKYKKRYLIRKDLS